MSIRNNGVSVNVTLADKYGSVTASRLSGLPEDSPSTHEIGAATSQMPSRWFKLPWYYLFPVSRCDQGINRPVSSRNRALRFVFGYCANTAAIGPIASFTALLPAVALPSIIQP